MHDWSNRSVVDAMTWHTVCNPYGPQVCIQPQKEHGEAILYIIQYLIKTQDLELHFKPNSSEGFSCYADAVFSGECNRDFVQNDQSTTKSRRGWFILYANCPHLVLQTQVPGSSV
ncbi:hypothetical protein ACHAW6_004783 [Cyclotella cf. meneghiniana]